MDAERRRHVEAIFDDVVDRPRSEWATAVRAHCRTDPDLADDVWSLLRAHERAEGILERSLPDAEEPHLDTRPVEDGDRIGRYRILRSVGRGGMGSVYLAERSDGHFRQRVALKVISRRDAHLNARVAAERQILASLQHPHIAHLLDGGVTEDGRAFLVMEYVDGLPIDVYCERMRLSVRERLEVFLTVLGAVEHAHHNLVVHRDLKPSNILVTPSGNVKLLDFGIAKLLNPTLGSTDTPETRADHRLLTPEYASPEQMKGERIATTSDVYSLGVLLYQLLSGSRPYEVEGTSLPELVRAVCEEDPPPPSERVTRSVLRRSLRGDLDAVVLKAMRKEPADRYGSVGMLAQDVERHISGFPVEAHRGSRAYRFKKFVRRRRREATAVAAVAVALVAGTVTATWQARLAARERDRAQTALLESTEVTEFLLGLFRASDPAEVPGDTITALDLLRRGVRTAESLREQPVVQARLIQVMAEAHENLGRYDEAGTLYERAMDLLADARGKRHPDVANAMVKVAVSLRNQARYDSAMAMLERARKIQEAALGPTSVEVARTLTSQARVAVYLGDLSGAERMARSAVTLEEAALGVDVPETLNAMRVLASVLRFEGKSEEAEEAFRDVLDRRRRLQEPDPEALITDMLQLADHLRLQGGRSTEAEGLYREAMALQSPLAGSDPTQVWALSSLSELMETKGDTVQAEALLRRAVEARRRTYGDMHPLVASILGSLGDFLTRAGRPGEAERILRQASAIDLETVGPDHTRHAATLRGLAIALAAQGKLVEADSAAARAVTIRTRSQGSRAPVVAQSLVTWGRIRTTRGLYSSAEVILLKALDISAEHPSERDVAGAVHGALAKLYDAWGRPADAARHRIASGS